MFIYKEQVMEMIFSYQEFMKNNFLLTVFVFDILIIISGFIVFPASIFEISNGFIFGSVYEGELKGFIYGFFNVINIFVIGAFLTYKFSKYLFGKKINQFLYDADKKKFKMFNYLLNIQPFKVLFLLRMSPLIPSAFFNIVIGGFEINNLSIFFSSYGGFPVVFFHNYIGFSAANFKSFRDSESEILNILFAIFGFVILILTLYFFTKISQRHLNKIIEENSLNENIQREDDEGIIWNY